MNWEATGAIGELLGAFGVILTLVYLAFQIRQNTQQLVQNALSASASAVNASVTDLRENRRAVFESAELTDIWLKGLYNPHDLAENESYRVRLVMINAVSSLWDVYCQTIVTGFSRETWETQGVSTIERVLASPGGGSFWTQFRENYPNEFRAEVDRILASKSEDT